jgi:hypothetical protein
MDKLQQIVEALIVVYKAEGAESAKRSFSKLTKEVKGWEARAIREMFQLQVRLLNAGYPHLGI